MYKMYKEPNPTTLYLRSWRYTRTPSRMENRSIAEANTCHMTLRHQNYMYSRIVYSM